MQISRLTSFFAALLECVKAKYYYSLKSLNQSIPSENLYNLLLYSHISTLLLSDCLTYTLEPRGTENAGRFLRRTMIITKLELLWSYLLKKGQHDGSLLFTFMYEQKYSLCWLLT